MTQNELKCTRSQNVKQTGCFKSCQGMNVVSYNIQEMEPKWIKDLKGPSIITNTRFLNNPKKTKMISKLSAQYNSFKKTYNFPTKYKSKLLKHVY